MLVSARLGFVAIGAAITSALTRSIFICFFAPGAPSQIRRPPGGGRPGAVIMGKEDGVILARPASVAQVAGKAN